MMFLQFTWGILQTVAGIIIGLLLELSGRVERVDEYKQHFVIRFRGKHAWGVSLGAVIILHTAYGSKTVAHEYGHCCQSAMLGPLYLVIVGIPSFLRACLWRLLKLPHSQYYAGYPERWADRLGGVKR